VPDLKRCGGRHTRTVQDPSEERFMNKKEEPGRHDGGEEVHEEGSSPRDSDGWLDGSHEPPWVEDLRILARREQFRLAAQLVAGEFSRLPSVHRVALIGSVAALPERDRPRVRRRSSNASTWHDPKDVDLAVWVTDARGLADLRRARSRAVDELFHRTGFGQCPKGKRECLVPHCGDRRFLRQFADFHFDPVAAVSPGAVTLFDRRLEGLEFTCDDVEIPF
jgi:hypothetical protein